VRGAEFRGVRSGVVRASSAGGGYNVNLGRLTMFETVVESASLQCSVVVAAPS